MTISNVDRHDVEKAGGDNNTVPRPRIRRLTFRSGVDLQTRLQLVPLSDGDCVGARVAAYLPPTDDGDDETSATPAAVAADGDDPPARIGAVPSDGDGGERRPGVDGKGVDDDDVTDAVVLRVTSLSTKDRDDPTSTVAKEAPQGRAGASFTSSSQPISQYEKVVRRLYKTNMYHPVKLGLKNIEQLHEALGNPMDRENVTVIHIAGTNGKGSVALKLAKTLELVGYKTGLFVSPHISSFRERMQVNGALISESDVEELLPKLFLTCEEEGIPATFFEVTTALAFTHFARQDVDAVVLETGLCGRLDATNVIRSPALSVITSIGLEHTRILGDTVELIAKEKAGIIKPNRPVLVGPNVPHDVIKQIAEERTSEYYVSEEVLLENFLENPGETTNADLVGDEADLNGTVDYDVENSRIAQAALTLLQRFGRVDRISKDDMIEGTSHRLPCRFETITSRDVSRRDGGKDNVSVVLDVAHNPPALKYLLNKLDATYPNVTKRFVVGFSADKDLARCAKMLLSSVPNSDPSHIHLVQAASPRAATIDEMLEAAPALCGSNFDKDNSSIAAQVTEGLQLAASNGEVLVVCGSVFIMSEAREALGIDEPQDSDYISEVAGVTFRDGQGNFADTDPCRATNSEDDSCNSDNHDDGDDGDWRERDFASILMEIRRLTGPLTVTLVTPEPEPPASSEEGEVRPAIEEEDEDESLMSRIAHNLDGDEIGSRAARSWTALRSAMQHQRTTETREAEAPTSGSPSWRDGIKRSWRGRDGGDDERRNRDGHPPCGVHVGDDDVGCDRTSNVESLEGDRCGHHPNGMAGPSRHVGGSGGGSNGEDVASRASAILDSAFLHGQRATTSDIECREFGTTSSGGGGRKLVASEGTKDVSDAAATSASASASAEGPPDKDVVGDETSNGPSLSSAAAAAMNDVVSCDSHESVSTLGSAESGGGGEGAAITAAMIAPTTTLSIEEDDGTDDQRHRDHRATVTGDATAQAHSPVRNGLRNLGSTVLRSTSNFISASEAARRAYAAAASATEAAAEARATTTTTTTTATSGAGATISEATTNPAPSSPADGAGKNPPPPLCDIYLRHDRGGGYVPVNGDSAATEAADGVGGAASIRNPLRRAAAAAAAAARSGAPTDAVTAVTNCSILAVRLSAEEGCPPSYEFQWYRSRSHPTSSSGSKDGDDRWSPLLGATHATYQPNAVDVGRLLRCVVFVPAPAVDDGDGRGGGGAADHRAENGGDSAAKGVVVECALNRAVEADRSLFTAARRSVFRDRGGAAAAPAATFGNLRGRGPAKGREFRISIRVAGVATTTNEEAGEGDGDGRIATTTAAAGTTTTSHVWIDQVAASTAESLCGGLPIAGVSASVDDPSDARNFELVLPPPSQEQGGLMVDALSVDDGGGGRKLRLAAPNRVTRESLLLVLGVANFSGRPSYLSCGGVLFPDLDSAAPPIAADSIQGVNYGAAGDDVRRGDEDDVGNSSDGQEGSASTQRTRTDDTFTTSASSKHTTIASAGHPTEDDRSPSDAAATRASETDADGRRRRRIASLEAAVAELGDRLTATRDHSSSLRKQLRDMEEVLCEKDGEAERLRNDLEIARSQHLDTCELLEKARKETDVKDRKLVGTEMEMMNGVTLMEERTAGYEARCAEYDKKVELLENENAELAAAIEDKDRELSKVEKVQDTVEGITSEEDEKEDLRKELEKSKDEITELRRNVKQMETEEKKLRSELESRSDSGRETKRKQERSEREKAELRKKVESLEAANNRLLSERNKFEHKAESLSKEVGKVFRHGVRIDDIEKLVQERKTLLQQIQDMKAEQRYAKAETDQLRLDFEQLLEYQTKSRFGAMIVQPSGSEDSVEHRQDLKKVISNLTEYLTAKEMQLETMKQVNRTLTEELDVLSKKLHDNGHR